MKRKKENYTYIAVWVNVFPLNEDDKYSVYISIEAPLKYCASHTSSVDD